MGGGDWRRQAEGGTRHHVAVRRAGRCCVEAPMEHGVADGRVADSGAEQKFAKKLREARLVAADDMQK